MIPGIVAGQAARPTGTLLLDLVPGAARAFGLRKLRTNYAGAAIRVVRSSDSAQQDIGFDGSGELDTAALLAFVGSGNGVITTWYDQSGNAAHATDGGTTSRRPRIVNAGALDTLGGKPAVFCTGGTGLTFSNAGAMRTDWTADIVFNTSQSNAGGGASSWYTMYGFLFSEQAGVVNDVGFGNYGNKLSLGLGTSGGTDNSLSGATDIRGTPHVGVNTRVSTSGAVVIYLDGASDATGTLGTGDRTASSNAWIGQGNSPIAYFGEAIIWPSVLNSTQLSALTSSQKSRFGIP